MCLIRCTSTYGDQHGTTRSRMDDTVVVKGCSLTSLHGPTNFLPLGGRLPNTLCTPERKLLTSERLRDCGVVAAA
jgi:hypothetical protein